MNSTPPFSRATGLSIRPSSGLFSISLAIFTRRRAWILSSLAACFGLAILYWACATPHYRATAVIEIQKESHGAFGLETTTSDRPSPAPSATPSTTTSPSRPKSAFFVRRAHPRGHPPHWPRDHARLLRASPRTHLPPPQALLLAQAARAALHSARRSPQSPLCRAQNFRPPPQDRARRGHPPRHHQLFRSRPGARRRSSSTPSSSRSSTTVSSPAPPPPHSLLPGSRRSSPLYASKPTRSMRALPPWTASPEPTATTMRTTSSSHDSIPSMPRSPPRSPAASCAKPSGAPSKAAIPRSSPGWVAIPPPGLTRKIPSPCSSRCVRRNPLPNRKSPNPPIAMARTGPPSPNNAPTSKIVQDSIQEEVHRLGERAHSDYDVSLQAESAARDAFTAAKGPGLPAHRHRRRSAARPSGGRREPRSLHQPAGPSPANRHP